MPTQMCEDEHLSPDPTRLTLRVGAGVALRSGLRDLAYQQEYLEPPQVLHLEEYDVEINVVRRV